MNTATHKYPSSEELPPLGEGVDVLRPKTQQEELIKAQKKQTQTIEALKYGILIVDEDGIITQCNKAYQEYSKLRGAEVRSGMALIDLAEKTIEYEKIDLGVPDFRIWFEDYFKTRFCKKDVIYEEEHNLSDGRHMLSRQYYDEHVGNIITIADITDVKKAQLKAQAAEQSRSEFLANMSHEIRTPLNGILGMTQILANANPSQKEANLINIISRSGEALLTIINDILDFSKIDAGQVKLKSEPFILRDTIEDVISLLSTAADDKNVDLRINIAPSLPSTVIGDAGRFRQIITNLVGNAVKFTHAGYVLIDVKGDWIDERAHLAISIEDTGIGIPQDQIDHVFEKFRQVDGTKTREYEGTGLGLSITKQIISLMKGNISVSSLPGKGTVFDITVNFPAPGGVQIDTVGAKNLAGSVILIVTEGKNSTSDVTGVLDRWQCKTIAVNSLRKALKVLTLAEEKGVAFNAVVIDCAAEINMQDTFKEQQKFYSSIKNIPTIRLISRRQDDIVCFIKGNPFEKNIAKPFRLSVLLETLTQLLELKNSTAYKQAPLRNNVISIANTTRELPSNRPNRTTCSKIDILVAEDNETNQMFMDYVLKHTGLDYKIVSDGQQAVEAFQTLSPRIIFMDLSMPNIDGYEATRRIRAMEAREHLNAVPIIAVTANVLKGVKAKCMKAGMDDYLAKPVYISQINSVLEKWDLSTFVENTLATV